MSGRVLVAVVGVAGLAALVAFVMRGAGPVTVAPANDARAFIAEHDAEMRRLLEGLAP